MRRESRQRGWAYAAGRSLVDPKGEHRAVQSVAGATTASSGFVSAPREPKNHSKLTGARAYNNDLSGKAAASAASKRRLSKFKRDEVKMHYLDVEGANDGQWTGMPWVHERSRIARKRRHVHFCVRKGDMYSVVPV